jgi:hypothetical protein
VQIGERQKKDGPEQTRALKKKSEKSVSADPKQIGDQLRIEVPKPSDAQQLRCDRQPLAAAFAHHA